MSPTATLTRVLPPFSALAFIITVAAFAATDAAAARFDAFRVPMVFTPNVGQAPEGVRFVARGGRYTVMLDESGATLRLQRSCAVAADSQAAASNESRRDDTVSRARGGNTGTDSLSTATATAGTDACEAEQPRMLCSSAARIELAGVSAGIRLEPLGPSTGIANYFRGNDPAGWHANVPGHAKVRYAQPWPGIDAVFYGNGERVEYDFVIAPGASPRDVGLLVHGRDPATIDADGNLVLAIGGSKLVQPRPFAYQPATTAGPPTHAESKQGLAARGAPVHGERVRGEGVGPAADGVDLPGARRRPVEARYVRRDDGRIGFDVGPYDPSRPLIIDPVILFSLWYGGTGSDFIDDIQLDGDGNLYVTGRTNSLGRFPLKDPVQDTYGGVNDAFVSKIAPSGTELVYSTYLGGGGDDRAEGIAVDGAGYAYVTGWTQSSDFPVANAFQPLPGVTQNFILDAFVTKLTPSGTLVYSTYFGGSGSERGYGIAADDSGHAYFVGETNSKDDFPAGPGFSTSCTTTALGSCSNGFVAKLEADGSDVVYSTYLGGSSLQQKTCAVAVDSMGDAVVVGVTRADDFPTQNAYQDEFQGFADFTITKLAPDGATLVWSTYLGGTDADGDICTGIAMDAEEAVYITSRTFSADIPTTGGFQPTFAEGTTDGYVAKFTSGGALVWGTYLGGSSSESPQDVFVAPDQSVYVVGFTSSEDFPLAGALQTERASSLDAFVSRLSNDGATLLFSTFLGGADNDEAHGVTADATGNVFVAGYTDSDDFPDAVLFPDGSASGIDGFIVKLGEPTPTTTTVPGTTTTTTFDGEPIPGDANGDGSVTATDALVTLKAAVGTASCLLCICDADGSGSISATDALLVLKLAVGQPVELMTPACV